MTIEELQNKFQMHIPIKDGEWWNGIPYLHEMSNLKQWHCKWTQGFGQNPQIYKQFNMLGHNGVDIGFSEGTPIVAPYDIEVQAIQYKDDGYGINLRAFTKEIDEHKIELVFGHFKEIIVQPYREYKEGTLLGYGDSTGFSTGHHIHFGIRPLYKKDAGWRQLYYNNGYYGYIDPEPFIIEKVRWTIGELDNLKKTMTNVKILKDENSNGIIIGLPVREDRAMMSYLDNYGIDYEINDGGFLDWDSIKINGSFKLK